MPILLALWLCSGMGDISLGFDQESGEMGGAVSDGSAIFYLNYYGNFEMGPIELYFDFEPNRSFSFQNLGGTFYAGGKHVWFEPGFVVFFPLWIPLLLAIVLPVIWLRRAGKRDSSV